MNIPLLRQIQKTLDKNPTRFEMSWWSTKTECGTAHCIAGWACVLSGHSIFPLSRVPVGLMARQLLDLTHDEGIRLFHEQYWPDQFGRLTKVKDLTSYLINSEFDKMRLSGEHAKLGIARIEHFIATEGCE